jgi:hypothetical protein
LLAPIAGDERCGITNPLVRAAHCCIGESAKHQKEQKFAFKSEIFFDATGRMKDTAFPKGPRLLVAADACRQPTTSRRQPTGEFTPLWAPSSQIRMRRCIRPQQKVSAKPLSGLFMTITMKMQRAQGSSCSCFGRCGEQEEKSEADLQVQVPEGAVLGLSNQDEDGASKNRIFSCCRIGTIYRVSSTMPLRHGDLP